MDIKKILISGALISSLNGAYGDEFHVGKHRLKPIVQDYIAEDYSCNNCLDSYTNYDCNPCQNVCEITDSVIKYGINGTANTVRGVYHESNALLNNVYRGVGKTANGAYEIVNGAACGEGCCEKIQGIGKGIGNVVLGVAETTGCATVNIFNIATTPVKSFLYSPIKCIDNYFCD